MGWLPLAGGNSATFTVKDWEALLSQGGPEAVLGKDVDVSGYVLDQGKDAYTGTGRELMKDPKVIQLYLGTLADTA